MILIGILSLINFAYWFFHPDFRGNSYLFAMLSVIFGYGILRHLYIWYHYAAISVPKIPESTQNYTVDVFTTYFPGEPLDMVENTLRLEYVNLSEVVLWDKN